MSCILREIPNALMTASFAAHLPATLRAENPLDVEQ